MDAAGPHARHGRVVLRPVADAEGPGFAFSQFGQLPVVFNGRLKPMDSVARNSLLEIREKQTLNAEPWKAWNESRKSFPPPNGSRT